MNGGLALFEIQGWSPAMVLLDVADKAAHLRLLQVELNDMSGTLIKVAGTAADLRAALSACAAVARTMNVSCTAHLIDRPDPQLQRVYLSPPEFSPLIQSNVVFSPRADQAQEAIVSSPTPFAIGFIETQGFTAVIEAIDTACKAANVEVVGKEKLGGGYITVVVKGDVAAVKAAIDAGKAKLEGLGLGKLIAAHVIARPGAGILSLLPKAG